MNRTDHYHEEKIVEHFLKEGKKAIQPKKKTLDQIFNELGLGGPKLMRPPPARDPRSKYPKGECGKVIFPSERIAKEAIHRRLNKGTGGATSLLAYHCKVCAGWHMSSRPTDGLKG